MQQKTFRFSDNFKGTGFYAKVSIRVAPSNAPDYSVEISEWVEPEWHTSIRFALAYFFRHYKKSLKVTIEELHTMIVDSSEITVVYAIVKCLSDLLDVQPELITFNNGHFEFKK